MSGPAEGHPCCSPSFRAEERAPRKPLAATRGLGAHTIPQAWIPGGTFTMGDHYGDGNRPDGETPLHAVRIAGLSMDAHTVTNRDFAAFVECTGHRTEAETFGFSAVFHLAVAARPEDVMGPSAGLPWWFGVRGASWRHPGGPLSDLDGLEDHPVVHVSWNDAVAYCEWAGRRLPTEAEWEHASRGGMTGARFPWGNELDGDGRDQLNIFHGDFPTSNSMVDGWLTTAPAKSYPVNKYGLWQMVGNVWEWCADWFDARYYVKSPRDNPQGPRTGQRRVLRGGSYLCHNSYCNRYRTSARSSNSPDSSMGNAGFRTVAAASETGDPQEVRLNAASRASPSRRRSAAET